MAAKKRLHAISTSALLLNPALAGAQELTSEYGALSVWIIALVFLFVVCIVATSLFIQHLSAKRHAELIERFLDSGREIPAELLAKSGWPAFQSPRVPAPRSGSMRRGVILLALAVGVSVLFYIGSGDLRAAAWGIPFLCLAIASFVNARFFSGTGSSD